MGSALSALSKVIHRDDSLDYDHYRRYHSRGDAQALRHQDYVNGNAPVDVVLLGDRAQSIMPKLQSLRSDLRAQTDDVRVVRRTPTEDGMQETTIFATGLTCTVLDVSLVPGELDAYRACLFHALAFVFVVDLSTFGEPDSSPTSLKSTLKEFEKLCCGTWCTQGIPIILVFDNEDVFSKNIAYGSFTAQFPDYQGEDDDAFAACQYLLARFMSMKTDRYGAVYVHFTFREDQRMARVLFAAVQDILLQRIIESSPVSSQKARRSSIFSLSRLSSRWKPSDEKWI